MPRPKKDQLEGQSFQLQLPDDIIGLDPEAFDTLIRSQGVQMVHFRSMRCPVGLKDPDDIRRGHEHHQDCSNGMVYTKAGLVTCGWLSNSKHVDLGDLGRLDGSTVTVVLPRTYDESDEYVDLTYVDRMYLKEESITVTCGNFTFATHITGVDRLCFPVVRVIDLMDAHGKRYYQDVDFCVCEGQIHWKDGKSPGVDPDTNAGVICSVRFTYRPYWYVNTLPHEVRVAQVEDEYFERRLQRMPKQAVLQREYHYEKAQRDAQAKDPEKRQHPEPSSGSFGPR